MEIKKSQKLDFVQNWISRAKKAIDWYRRKKDLPVENVVLNHEEEIKYDWKEAQPEFGGVAENRSPVVCNEIMSFYVIWAPKYF